MIHFLNSIIRHVAYFLLRHFPGDDTDCSECCAGFCSDCSFIHVCSCRARIRSEVDEL